MKIIAIIIFFAFYTWESSSFIPQFANSARNIKLFEINKENTIGGTVTSNPVTTGDTAKNLLKTGMKAIPFMSALLLNSLFTSAARADSREEANNKLTNYGFPPMLYIPNGFSPLVSEYGRGGLKEKMSNPILVQFAYPSTWVVQKTSVNTNGEAGTISANGTLTLKSENN